MKNKLPPPFITIFLSIFIGLCMSLSFTHSLHATDIMKLSEIKIGMKGEGRSIFKGTEIESFDFEVLGIIRNFVPDKNLIIVDIKVPVENNSGVIAGMSGSPAYIDGKLIGAIAYGFGFSRKPIGGITPIEDILEVKEHNKPAYSIDISNIKLEFDKKNLENIADLLHRELSRRVDFTPVNGLPPLHLPALNRGFRSQALLPLRPMFAAAGTIPLGSQTGQKPKKKTPKRDLKRIDTQKISKDLLDLRPADAVVVPLITGDYQFASLGTVTHVDGQDAYLFGHPYFNLGTVDFPLYKADIITVMPSYQNSFKMGSARNMIGRMVQDRYSSCFAKLGSYPYMVPMKVFLKSRNKHLKFEMVNHPILTPILSGVTMTNLASAEFQDFGYQSIKVKGKIFIEGERNIIIDDLYSGTESFGAFSNLLLAINFFVMNNREKDVKIQKMDFEITGSEMLRRSFIENILVEKQSYVPGEIIRVTLFLRNEKGSSFTEQTSFQAPNLKAGSTFYIMVADGIEMARFESQNIRTNYFPVKLRNLIRAINNLRKNNRLYFKLMTPTKGMFVKGHEYPHLPSSMQNLFNYNTPRIYRSSTRSQSNIRYSTLTEYQMEFPTVVRGNKLFKLKIRERSDDQK